MDFIQFGGSLSLEIMQSLSMKESGVYHFFDLRLFHKHMMALYRIHQKDSALKAELLSKACYDFLLDLPSCIYHIDRKDLLAANGPLHESVSSVLQYLEIHYSEDITLEQLSLHTGYEKNICVLFLNVKPKGRS